MNRRLRTAARGDLRRRRCCSGSAIPTASARSRALGHTRAHRHSASPGEHPAGVTTSGRGQPTGGAGILARRFAADTPQRRPTDDVDDDDARDHDDRRGVNDSDRDPDAARRRRARTRSRRPVGTSRSFRRVRRCRRAQSARRACIARRGSRVPRTRRRTTPRRRTRGALANFSQWSSAWNSDVQAAHRRQLPRHHRRDHPVGRVQVGYGSDDVIRAEAVVESTWRQSTAGDGGNSFGLLQIKWNYHPAGPAKGAVGSSWPNSAKSTAYAVDQQVAEMRGCYDGMSTYLGNTRGDLWGCLQSWYSGQLDAGRRCVREQREERDLAASPGSTGPASNADADSLMQRRSERMAARP